MELIGIHRPKVGAVGHHQQAKQYEVCRKAVNETSEHHTPPLTSKYRGT